MTDDAIRIAIAEERGFITPHYSMCIRGNIMRMEWTGTLNGEIMTPVPNYPGDLNAMHEVEKTLTNEQRRQYVQFLVQVHPLRYDPFEGFEDDPQAHDGYMKVYFLVQATARQRAEAFLRVKGKWEP